MTAPDSSEERSRPGAYVRWEGGERVLVGREPSAMPGIGAGPAPSDTRRSGASVTREDGAVVHVGHERADELSRFYVTVLLCICRNESRTSPEG